MKWRVKEPWMKRGMLVVTPNYVGEVTLVVDCKLGSSIDAVHQEQEMVIQMDIRPDGREVSYPVNPHDVEPATVGNVTIRRTAYGITGCF